MNSRMTQAKERSPAGEPTPEDPLQGLTPATNADNLSIVGKLPLSRTQRKQQPS